MKTFKRHSSEVEKIAKEIKEYATLPQNIKLRFNHGGTNSTRNQHKDKYYWVNISHLNDVIEVNEKEKYALIEPNVPMDKLVENTLKFGLIPAVVMEFPGITVGGGINGATLESSSYKYGQFSDICEEYEIVLGNGEIIKASPKENNDIFYGMSGIYGTLGLLTLAKVKLISVKPYVHTIYTPVKTYADTLSALREQMKKEEVDFLEGVIHSPQHAVIITGTLTDKINLPIQTYSKAKDPWFYETGRRVAKTTKVYEELIPITDYLFRYNRGAFWMGEFIFPFLHFPNNKITRYLLNPFINTRKLYDGMHAVNMAQNYFIQDFYVPFNKSQAFLEFTEQRIGIFPIWLCPVKPTQTPQKLSPHYIDTDLIIDIGIWGQTKKYMANPIDMNRKFEAYAKDNYARKMLYAHAYYTEDEFWKLYDKKWYDALRSKYYAEKVFPTIWQKVHVSERYHMNKKGIFKVLGETLLGKHINT